MTKIEEFVSYASKLPAARLGEVEAILGAIMSADSAGLSPEQEAEITSRLSNADPSYAKLQDVEAILGKPFKT